MSRVSRWNVWLIVSVAGIGCDVRESSTADGGSPDTTMPSSTPDGAATSSSGGGGAATVAPDGSSAGGASGGGGDGGARPVPGEHGFVPATVSVSDATQAYERFKDLYLEDCGNGEIRVVTNGLETVSEGIAYGMLLAVAHGERPLFDGFWNYYKARRDTNGLMHWKFNACTTERWGENAATDADLDAAMALIQADCRWSGYAADAGALLDAIRQHETVDAGGTLVLRPGDVWGGAGCTNPSYFSPAYYRVFAQFDSENADFWNQLADDSYTILDRASHVTTGLVPDWTDVNGVPGGTSDGCPKSANYGYDAARTPWRIATDYVWWGIPDAKTWLDRATSFVEGSGGIHQVGDGYSLDGVRLSQNHNSTFTGAFALAALAHSQVRADEFMTGFLAVSGDDAYFQETLRAVYLLIPTGLFASGCR